MHCDIAQISKMSTWSEQFVHIFPGKQKLNKERGGRMKIFCMAFGKAYYSNIDIFFANEYVNKCKEYAKEVYLYDKK